MGYSAFGQGEIQSKLIQNCRIRLFWTSIDFILGKKSPRITDVQTGWNDALTSLLSDIRR
jgi:hypothetical protein